MEQQVLLAVRDSSLRAYVVWVPKRGATEKDVPVATRLVPDPRARQYWDASGAALRAYAASLGIRQDAWDVYLLYGPKAHWNGAIPPRPRFWMHQLEGVTSAPFLNGRVLARETAQVLEGR